MDGWRQVNESALIIYTTFWLVSSMEGFDGYELCCNLKKDCYFFVKKKYLWLRFSTNYLF